jgi:NADH dehydrogenase
MASGHFYPAAITVWAAGIKAPDALRELGIRVNGINQVEVGADLLSYDDNNIYALGDCAALPVGEDGQTVPPRAQAAHQQASHIAQAIERRLAGRPAGRPYRYRDYGSLVTLGRYSTVGSLMGSIAGNVWISGVIARLVYLSLYKMHQVTLHGLWNTTLLTLSSLLRRSVNPEVKLH